jgi:hypothetical protein
MVLVACSQRDTGAQQSAGRVARAIEVLRNAPNDGKASALQALGALPCQGPDVCETRDSCRSAYALHVDGVNLTAAARQKTADGQNVDAANLLGSAQQLLQESAAKIQDCIERESALKRRYKL